MDKKEIAKIRSHVTKPQKQLDKCNNTLAQLNHDLHGLTITGRMTRIPFPIKIGEK